MVFLANKIRRLSIRGYDFIVDPTTQTGLASPCMPGIVQFVITPSLKENSLISCSPIFELGIFSVPEL